MWTCIYSRGTSLLATCHPHTSGPCQPQSSPYHQFLSATVILMPPNRSYQYTGIDLDCINCSNSHHYPSCIGLRHSDLYQGVHTALIFPTSIILILGSANNWTPLSRYALGSLVPTYGCIIGLAGWCTPERWCHRSEAR